MSTYHLPAPYTLRNINRFFWLFLVIHTLLWTLGPALLRPTVPHDTLEGISWGLQWQLGYNKHPFLAAWLCAGITQLFATVGWPVYLLAQLAVTTTFIAVWKLARLFAPPIHAVIATLALEGVLFYNLNSFNFTPDTLQSPLWALLALFFYQAIETQKTRYWLSTAVVAALCVCTKYQVGILFIPMLLLCIINPTARQSFKKPGLYYALLTFLVLITPHLVWLYQHDFVTINYAVDAPMHADKKITGLKHFLNPVHFLLNNILYVIGVFVLLFPFYFKDKMDWSLTRFQWQFLLFLGLGPITLSLLMAFITGNLYAIRWSTPYYFALGILIIALVKPSLTPKSLKQFFIALVVLSTLLFSLRMLSLSVHPRPNSDAFLPNKKIAVYLSDFWQKQYHSPLPYLAGSNYLVAGVAPYMQDKPIPYLSCLQSASFWINEHEMRQKGAIFIWDTDKNYSWDQNSEKHIRLTKELMKRFPEIQILPPLTFYRLSNQKPIRISIAIIPPKA